eukprot:gene29332-35408_t
MTIYLHLVIFLFLYVEVAAKQPNFLLILADDLGFGDTSVRPFVGSGIKTPELEKMAKNGAILTNYHTAAATCTPTRASILTGMYPWRMGLKAVYEYGQKGNSNRDDWLPQLPTGPGVFAKHNYTVFHSGKWHVGGMRNDDHDMRRLPNLPDGENTIGKKRCPHPGPQQQGFQHYVSVLDGPGAPRQNDLQVSSTLYSRGCRHLLRDDEPISPEKTGIAGYLTYCEAQHAMRAMDESVKEGKPFYIHVWFHAPHGPWENVPPFAAWYPDHHIHRNHRFAQYRTMVSDMDKNIGMLLEHVEKLGISENTLVVFSSDNGPEDGAGSAGPLRGNKRFIFEGGIRVPALAQWKGVIAPGSEVGTMVVSTDWLPTFLEAANFTVPAHMQIDGHSVLQDLAPAYYYSHYLAAADRTDHKAWKQKRKATLQERLVLWHNDFEGPRRTAAWLFDFKVLLDQNEMPFMMYDLHTDVSESNNLIADRSAEDWRHTLTSCAPFDLKHNKLVYNPKKSFKAPVVSKLMLRAQRQNSTLHTAVVCRVYRHMLDFVQRGDEGYRKYLQTYPELKYNPTPFSDQRPCLGGIRETPARNEELKRDLLYNTGCGKAPCSCAYKNAYEVQTFPFSEIPVDERGETVIAPYPFVNASRILGM